jgi:pimeloyl-ACP methyl ester carboxylesterase
MPTTNCNHGHIYLIGVREQVVSDTCKRITLSTTRGDLKAQLHIDRGVRQAVIMLGDEWSEDGFDSQFDVIADELSGLGIGAMSLQYRVPCDCAECAIDVLLLCQYLDDEGISDVVLLGWSYGAAVALAAGSVCRTVRGIAAVSPADISQCCLRWVAGKPLLLMSGENGRNGVVDNIIKITSRAKGYVKIQVYPNHDYYLSEKPRRAVDDLLDWILEVLSTDQDCLCLSSTSDTGRTCIAKHSSVD